MVRDNSIYPFNPPTLVTFRLCAGPGRQGKNLGIQLKLARLWGATVQSYDACPTPRGGQFNPTAKPAGGVVVFPTSLLVLLACPHRGVNDRRALSATKHGLESVAMSYEN